MSVEVDKREFDAVMLRVETAAKSQPDAMKRLALVLDQRVRATFREERDPWGIPWPPLAPGTLEARAHRGNFRTSMLIDTGEMYNTLQRDSDATSASISIGEGTDHPAEVHQFGSTDGRVPARPMFPMRTPGEAAFPDDWLDEVLAPIQEEIQKAVDGR